MKGKYYAILPQKILEASCGCCRAHDSGVWSAGVHEFAADPDHAVAAGRRSENVSAENRAVAGRMACDRAVSDRRNRFSGAHRPADQ